MPIAAVPNYLGQDFKDTSPGMRFGMYLKLWGINRRTRELLWTTADVGYEVRGQDRREREVRYENKVPALSDAKCLNGQDKKALQALVERQRHCFEASFSKEIALCLSATAIAPFTTGLGNEHPLENGFAFLWPYGLPYLPGSGVKGVLRQAARELASGAWGDSHGWSEEKVYTLSVGKESIPLSVIDVLFGREAQEGEREHVRGALSFWDVIPEIKGDSLMIEIMTPHQGHYYQWKKDQRGNLIEIAPHDCGQPNPIYFLTVPPGSVFRFYAVCDQGHLSRLTAKPVEGAPDLLEAVETKPRWQVLVKDAFKHAFQWLGFGAKTAVGYGAMRDTVQHRGAGTAQVVGAKDFSPPPSENTEYWPQATLGFDPGKGAVFATFQGQKTSPVSGERAQALLAQLGEEQSARLKKKKSLSGIAVKVKKQGNLIELVEIGS